MTNPRRRWLFTRQDDPDEYRPGRTETIGCWRLGHGWTATESYTAQDKAMEPAPTLPQPKPRKSRARLPGTVSRARAKVRAMLDAFTQIAPPPPPPPPPEPQPATPDQERHARLVALALGCCPSNELAKAMAEAVAYARRVNAALTPHANCSSTLETSS